MRKLAFLIIAGLAGACSPYNPELGNAPYLCADAEPFCPEGYFCQNTSMPAPKDRVCVSEGGLMPDSGETGFPCANDSNLEGGTRNDTPMTAYQTPVDTQLSMISLADLAICPEGDKDHYAITLSQGNQAIEVTVSWDSGQPISMSLLNAGGTAIVNGTMTAERSLRACAPNMPMGTYYGAVFATGSVKNNYRMTIKILPSC